MANAGKPEKVIVKYKRPRERIDRSFAIAILALREYFDIEKRLKHRVNLDKVVERVSQALQVSRNVVCEISSEESLEKFREADEEESRKRNMAPPDSMAEVIRTTVFDMYSKKKVMPTVANIFKRLKEGTRARSTAWKWSKVTLYRYMLQIGFTFGRGKTYYEHVTERPDIRQQRSAFIRWVRHYRSEGYEIFYQGETWVFKNIAQSKIWLHGNVDVGHKVPFGTCDRSIISHTGSSKSGLLEGGLLLHRCSKSNKSSDYHTEISSDLFLDWLEKRIFPKLQEKGKCVLVIDRAMHHLVKTEETRPVNQNQWRKGEITQWIQDRNIQTPDDWPLPWEGVMTKAELLGLAMANNPKPRYLVQDLADRFGVKILILPAAHPELSPIEMVWSNIKPKYASKSMNFNFKEVEKIAEEEMSCITPEEFARHERHTMDVEEKYWADLELE